MNRLFYTLVLLNMFVNTLIYVPAQLIQHRLQGAVMGILLGTVISFILMLVLSISLNKTPKQGLPELLNKAPKWLKVVVLVSLSCMWFLAGANTLLGFNNIVNRYMNPEISEIHMVTVFSLMIIMALVKLSTVKVLYVVEMIVILNIPISILVLTLSYTNNYISWHSVLEVSSYISKWPDWSSLSAATYVFSGYANMIVFNRVFDKRVNVKWLWPLLLLGLFQLTTIFFMPIGFHGVDGVGDLKFPWITTVDSLRMELAPIERVTTIFLISYVSLAIVSVIVHWHVAFELLKGTVKTRPKLGNLNFMLRRIVFIIFGVAAWFMEKNMREENIKAFGEAWLQIRLPFEILLVIVLLFLTRRRAA